MRILLATLPLSLCLAFGSETSPAQVPSSWAGEFYSTEWNSVMVENTFRVEGSSAEQPGKNTIGTVFVLGAPYKTDLEDGKLKKDIATAHATLILISAAHVFKGVASDYADLYMRNKGTNGEWAKLKFLYRFDKRVSLFGLSIRLLMSLRYGFKKVECYLI